MVKNDKQISLSIIMPFLDAKEDIKDLFTCLQKQINVNKKNVEIIIINDGSTDGTAQEIKKRSPLLEDYDSLRVIEHDKKMGHITTRIDGAKAAKGKHLVFIDKKGRPDKDYLYSFISKNRNIIIGNPYVDKTKNLWSRVLVLLWIKLYYPYFNHPFDDIELDHDQYAKFKNKGGGGSMFVLKKYYLAVSKTMPTGIHVSDDSLLVSKLAEIEPILKTSSAKLEYLNRTGFTENVIHLYNRGPKFVNFYAKPSSRFFIPIIGLISFTIINVAIAFIYPLLLIYELFVLLISLFVVSIYLSESFIDFASSMLIIPIATIAFSCGVIKGLMLKLFRKY